MIYFAIYTTTTGAIQKVVGISDPADVGIVAVNTAAGESSVQAPEPEITDPITPSIAPSADKYYVTGGDLVLRLELTTLTDWDTLTIDADGTDAATIGPGLPDTALVSIVPDADVIAAGVKPSTTIEVDDGSFAFTTPLAGTYTVSVSNVFPFLDYTTEITAS